MEQWHQLTDEPLESALNRPFSDETLVSWIQDRLAHGHSTRIEAIKAARLNPTFGYQIISGARKASRDKLVQLAFGMDLDVDDTCHLLVLGGHAPLRPENRRDFIIAWCLSNGCGVEKTDDVLWAHGEATVADR